MLARSALGKRVTLLALVAALAVVPLARADGDPGERLPAHTVDLRAARPRDLGGGRFAALGDRRVRAGARLHDPRGADREHIRPRLGQSRSTATEAVRALPRRPS